jgi:hypothetical protein
MRREEHRHCRKSAASYSGRISISLGPGKGLGTLHQATASFASAAARQVSSWNNLEIRNAPQTSALSSRSQRTKSRAMAMLRDEVISVLGPVDEVMTAAIITTGATVEKLREAWAWINSDEALLIEGRSFQDRALPP